MIGKTLSYHLKRGKFRFVGKPLYEGLINMQLSWIRHKDRNIIPYNAPLCSSELTAVIKTFERPDIVDRLLTSLRRYYPDMQVVVVDDSAKPIERPGVHNIHLPYDSGVSAGRQAGIDAVKTPYVLLLDDDFVFYRYTLLEDALIVMKQYSQIDIMGGEVVNLPSFKSTDYRYAKLWPTKRTSLIPPGTRLGPTVVLDKVPNFYIARTDRLRLVGWDKRIKRIDHADFFTRAKGVLVTAYNPMFKILHAQTPFKDVYLQKRYDVENDRRVLYERYYSS